MTYEGSFDLGPGALASLPDVPRFARLRSLGGSVDGKLLVRGTQRDVFATLDVAAKDIGTPASPTGDAIATPPRGPQSGLFDIALRVDVGSEKTTVLVDAALADERLAKLEGSLGLSGVGLIPRARALDPALDLVLEVPARNLDTLATISPLFREAPGAVSGRVRVGGSVKEPSAEGAIGIDDVEMVDGSKGGLGVDLALTDQGLSADIGVGRASTQDAPLKLSATISREDLAKLLRPDGDVAARVSAKASKVSLARLIPKRAMRSTPVEVKGALDWDMKARVDLRRESGKTTLEDGSIDGTLALTGTVPIPGTGRVYRDVRLALSASGDEIAIDALRLHESDREVHDRWLSVTGALVLDKLRPTKVDLALASHKWLLFGAGSLGKADAPRGALTIDAKAHAELDRPVKLATIDVDKLIVEIPDRLEKAHQPEDVHVGDVIVLGQGDVGLGKLPVPESVQEKARLAAVATHAPSWAPLPSPAVKGPGETTAPAEQTGLDIDVHIAQGARIFQSPIDLVTGGDLSISIRPSGRVVRGKLVMTQGELSLGGTMHPLREGSLVFDEAHPTGFVDLLFERPMPPWALRDVSEASAGTSLTIHTFGPLSDRKSFLSGAGSPGGLFDLLSMHNVGRERLYSEADLPESVTVEFPQPPGLLALSFIAVNLPHLLFLDRVAAWSDPYDDHRAYGRLEHYEAERYFADGKGRFRAGKRPAGMGRSEAEVELDYLFMNEARVLFGVGATAGSRGGGGPSLVFEWSSRD